MTLAGDYRESYVALAEFPLAGKEANFPSEPALVASESEKYMNSEKWLVILAAVMFTIEKAKAISASIPHGNPPVGHIHPSQVTILPMLLLTMISAVGAGVISWAVLFALRRSGIQQLSEMNPSSGQSSRK